LAHWMSVSEGDYECYEDAGYILTMAFKKFEFCASIINGQWC